MRLSDLLERIRPAGAPGAAGEGEQQRRRENRDRELANIIAALRRPEEAAADVVTEAHQQVELLHAETKQAMDKLRTELPELLAVKRTTVPRTDDTDVEHLQLVSQARAEAARITQHAADGTPKLVAAALDSIWSTVLESSAEQGTP